MLWYDFKFEQGNGVDATLLSETVRVINLISMSLYRDK